MSNWIWPLKDLTPMFPDEPGRFGVQRLHDYHTGVDLYCEMGQEVVAVEDGEVVLVEWFTGAKSPDASPWWNDTQAILVRGVTGVVTYGEVKSLVSVGDFVKQGQVIAVVEKPVLKTNKGRPMVMLHIELMRHDAMATLWWKLGETQPEQLWNPEFNLFEAANHKEKIFDLRKYDGSSFIDLTAPKKDSPWWVIWKGRYDI